MRKQDGRSCAAEANVSIPGTATMILQQTLQAKSQPP